MPHLAARSPLRQVRRPPHIMVQAPRQTQPFRLLFVTQNFDRKKSCGSTRRDGSGCQTDQKRRGADPNCIECVRLKWNVGNRIHLRVERNQPVSPRSPGREVSRCESGNGSDRADRKALQNEDVPHLFPARTHCHQDGDVARPVTHRHCEHDKNVKARNESNQADEECGNQFFQVQRAEQGAILVLPRVGREAGARLALKLCRRLRRRDPRRRAETPVRSRRRPRRPVLAPHPASRNTSSRRSRRIQNRKSPRLETSANAASTRKGSAALRDSSTSRSLPG